MASGVWLDYRRMLVRNANVLVDNYVWCTHCKGMTSYFGSTTSRLLEHQRKCPNKPIVESDEPPKIQFKLNELTEIRDAAAHFIVKDCQPFIAIDGKGLLDLCYASANLGRKYTQMSRADLANAFPSPNTIKIRVKQMAVDGVSWITRKLRHSITNTERIAATADMWTEPLNSTATLALTLHFFSIEEATIVLEAHTVNLLQIDAPSITGNVIKSGILQTFSDYGMNEEEVEEYVCMVTDRGSNMLSAVSCFESEVCLAHLCNNVIGQMMKVPEMKDIVTKATALVRYMKTSHAASQMTSKLKSYPDTRFNYCHDMLESIENNRAEVYDVLRAKEETGRQNRNLTEKITCLPSNKLKDLCGFLSFFKSITTVIEGDKKVTLHRVWPVLRELRAKLQPDEMDSDLIATMKSAGLTYIEKPDNVQYFNPTTRHRLALFLHPLMNRLSFLNFRGRVFIDGSLKTIFFWLRLFTLIQLISIEITSFHAEVSEMLESIPEPASLVTVRTTNTPSTSSSSSSSSSAALAATNMSSQAGARNENSLFQGYYNNNVGENVRYDELEEYIAVVIPPVSQCDTFFLF